jgi:hypothetical protein
VDVNEGVVSGFGWFLDEGHTCRVGSSAAFSHVAGGAGTDDICPDGFAACASWDYVVEGQFAGGLLFAAVLTAVPVTREDVSAVELYFGSGQTVVEEQANYPWDSDVEVDRGNPVVVFGFEVAFEFADLAPALKVVVGVGAFLTGDDLG